MFRSTPELAGGGSAATGRRRPQAPRLSLELDDEPTGAPAEVPQPHSQQPRGPRACIFGQRLQLDFAGSVLPAAVCLGDLDNDGANELVVGSAGGQLAVFKGLSGSTPWLRSEGLGAIACVAICDGLLWAGHTSLAVVTAEGWLHLFHRARDWRDRLPASAGRRPRCPAADARLLGPLHTARVPLNGETAAAARRHLGTLTNAALAPRLHAAAAPGAAARRVRAAARLH